MLTQNARDTARKYIKNGLYPVPIPAGGKNPGKDGWQNLRLTADDVSTIDTDANIGIILGEPSRHIVDIDLDCPEAIIAARDLLPETRRFGRATAMDSHYLYFCEGAKTSKYQYKTMLVELRSTGTQTVFPGSIHGKTGEPITWANVKKRVQTITPDELKACVDLVAAVALLARELSTWDSGRHDAYLALTGALLHGKIPAAEVKRLLCIVIDASGDPEPRDRVRVVVDTCEHYAGGGEVQGWPTLAEYFDSALTKKLKKWLPIDEHCGLKINGARAADAASAAPDNSAASAAAAARGRSPEPLFRALPAAEEFPVDALGAVLAPMATAMAEIIQAPPALCGQSVLAAASLAVQAHADVEIVGRILPASLDLITVADSGERKTACDKEALAPHRKREADLVAAYQVDEHTHSIALEAYQRAREATWKDKNLGPEAQAAAVTQLGLPPEAPIQPLLLIEEPTYEGLVKQLNTGWPSPGLFSDEGGRFIGGHGMSSDNQLKTAAGLSSLWDGTPITRVRSGEGTTRMAGRRLSLHLMIQPAVSNQLFGNQLLMSQGLLSRLLVASPESTIGGRPFRDEALRDRAEAKQYFARMMAILEHPLPLVEGTQNQLDPRITTLDSDAKSTWIKYHDHIEAQCGTGGELHTIKGLAAKAAEQAARIALVLALADDLNTEVVAGPYMNAGIALSQFYISEALRLFNVAPAGTALDNARQLLEWVQSRPSQPWEVRDLYTYGPPRVRTKDTALAALEVLEQHGWAYQEGGHWEFRK